VKKLLLLLVLAVGLLILNPHHNSSTEAPWEAPRAGQWSEPPTVILCNSAPIERAQVESAMDWWRKRGHLLGELIEEKQKPAFTEQFCKGPVASIPFGHITISELTENVEQEPGDLAITEYLALRTFLEVTSAKIYLRPEYVQDEVVTHEMGHSLGFLHWHDRGHLMNPSMELGGWDDTGLSSHPGQDDGELTN